MRTKCGGTLRRERLWIPAIGGTHGTTLSTPDSRDLSGITGTKDSLQLIRHLSDVPRDRVLGARASRPPLRAFHHSARHQPPPRLRLGSARRLHSISRFQDASIPTAPSWQIGSTRLACVAPICTRHPPSPSIPPPEERCVHPARPPAKCLRSRMVALTSEPFLKFFKEIPLSWSPTGSAVSKSQQALSRSSNSSPALPTKASG